MDNAKADAVEKRGYPRRRMSFKIKVLEAGKLVGAVHDISSGGFRLELTQTLVDNERVNEWTGEKEDDAIIKELSRNTGEIYHFNLEHLGTYLDSVYARLVHVLKRHDKIYMGLKFIGTNEFFIDTIFSASSRDSQLTIDDVIDKLDKNRKTFHSLLFPEKKIFLVEMPKELDNITVRNFKEEISLLVEKKEYSFLFDFTKTTFLNSVGIGTLYANSKTVLDSGHDVRFNRISPAVNKIMSIVGLTKKIAVIDNEIEYLNKIY